jgi:hypothetical protein
MKLTDRGMVFRKEDINELSVQVKIKNLVSTISLNGEVLIIVVTYGQAKLFKRDDTKNKKALAAETRFRFSTIN